MSDEQIENELTAEMLQAAEELIEMMIEMSGAKRTISMATQAEDLDKEPEDEQEGEEDPWGRFQPSDDWEEEEPKIYGGRMPNPPQHQPYG
jgi:hypothetical protein